MVALNANLASVDTRREDYSGQSGFTAHRIQCLDRSAKHNHEMDPAFRVAGFPPQSTISPFTKPQKRGCLRAVGASQFVNTVDLVESIVVKKAAQVVNKLIG